MEKTTWGLWWPRQCTALSLYQQGCGFSNAESRETQTQRVVVYVLGTEEEEGESD